ncbi:MAG: peptidoglycan editing factor PgeF [Oscillospiraceae bacterium]|nr:peptidoglycan editing factor PgeF [Oscillospiraceae bacterium]
MAFIENNKNGVVYMTSPNITAKHAFTTRFGGVSEGIYASLNLKFSCGDDDEKVAKNYRILAETLEIVPVEFAFSKQVHRDDIRVCTMEDRQGVPYSVPYEADGLITDVKDLPLVIFTADCTPILLHDPVRGVVGAVHAGWRGTVVDIAGKAVRKMCEVYGCDAGSICAAIGPCISECCFETGAEVYEAVKAVLGDAAERYAEKKPNDKYMIDLKGVNAHLLKRAGVKNIEISEECTKCSCEKYWSHRATNGKRGTQCSCIVL